MISRRHLLCFSVYTSIFSVYYSVISKFSLLNSYVSRQNWSLLAHLLEGWLRCLHIVRNYVHTCNLSISNLSTLNCANVWLKSEMCRPVTKGFDHTTICLVTGILCVCVTHIFVDSPTNSHRLLSASFIHSRACSSHFIFWFWAKIILHKSLKIQDRAKFQKY
jgi:hypothetical protein